MLKFCIVICTKRRSTILTRCLSAVADLRPTPTMVIVVDNTEGDKGTEQVAKEFGVHYVIEPKAGLSRARKRGLAECESDVVVYLDDDAVPDSKWLGEQLASHERKKVPTEIGKVLNITSRRTSRQSDRKPQ